MTDHDRLPIILDVDTGIDDALALLYACAAPEAELVAVTCVSGNAALPDTLRNTHAVLELAGRADVEVAAGRPVPLHRPPEITPETHGPRGLGYAELPEPSGRTSERFGPDLIVTEARRRPGELTLVTLGPLTNLAIAVLAEPGLPRLLRRWVCMGGAFRVPGNTTPVSEWNIHCDPEAACIVFRAWQTAVDADAATPRGLVLGLDATEQARLLPGDLAAIRGANPGGEMARFLDDALGWYFEFHARYDGFLGAFVHDPLVVAAAFEPGMIRAEAVHVEVDVSGGAADGQTIADWRRLLGRAPNVDVAIEVDTERFKGRLIERLGGLTATGRG